MAGLYVSSNSTALAAQFNLTRNMGSLGETLARLSTGLRINSGKDDPAGLIANELLKADITGTTKAISNTQRAGNLLATADQALGQVGNILNDIKGLVVEAANSGAMSVDQIRANQLQIDASIDSINRIAQTTTYAGKKLLDGSLGFQTSDVDHGTIGDLQIDQANFGTSGKIAVEVDVQQTARKGTLIYDGVGVDKQTTIEVTGSIGTQSFSFGVGTTNSTIAASINATSDSTGVTARVEGLPSRGIVELNGVGADNGIVITANEEGFDAGNYTFRIVEGASNDVQIVSEPTHVNPGVVEIALTSSYEANYRDFLGLFNVSINTGSGSAATSVSMSTGTVNRAFFAESATSATATAGGTTVIVTDAGTDGAMSKLNDWTVEILDDGDTALDLTSKVLKTTADDLDAALQWITGASTAVTTTVVGSLTQGDRLTFKGGADAGELVISHKEGATAGEILKILNNLSNVQASFTSDVSENTLIPFASDSSPRVALAASQRSAYTSNVTANELVTLINDNLGDQFTASLKTDSSGAVNGTGLMTFMKNASATYGSATSDNGLVFTGMDSGPIVRMVTSKTGGTPAADQSLGVRLIQPSTADIAAGRSTPILEIQLATDSQGNSITMAADIVALFNRLTPTQTGGINASLIYPEGVDPNGRTWVTDECGNVTEIASCGNNYGQGIVLPTGRAGPCEIQQNDIVLLGNNQTIQQVGYPVARIPSATVFDTTNARATNTTETVGINFGETAALNGVSMDFTTNASLSGFNATTGRWTVYIDPASIQLTDADFNDAIVKLIDGQLAQNWVEIRKYTHATGDPPSVQSITYSNDYTDLLALVNSTSADAVLNVGGVGSGKTTPITLTFDNSGGGDTTAQFWLETDSDTDELNGFQIKMGGWPGLVGNVLTVQNLTGAQGSALDLAGALESAINQALNDASFTSRITVNFIENDGWTLAISEGAVQNLNFGIIEGGSIGGGATFGEGGIGTDDPALLLISNEPGTPRSGAVASFIQDDTLPVGDISSSYDEARKILTVRGNVTNGVMAAEDLATLLNANENYLKYFQTIDLTHDVTSGASVAFSSLATPPVYTFVGGYEIVTESLTGGVSGGAATSSGLAMSGGTDDNQRLVLEATEYGSGHFVQVVAASGSTFDTYSPLGVKMNHFAGTDIVATVNGVMATGRGTNIEINTSDLALSMNVANTIGSTSFSITGGGTLFQLGSNVASSQQVRLGLSSVLSTHLGGPSGYLDQLKSGGSADLTTSDASRALADRIVGEAIASIATTRGRLGAIQKSTLEPNISVLQDSLVALTEAQSMITDADFAEDSSDMTRYQLLIQAGMQTLGIANQFPQYAAQLVL